MTWYISKSCSFCRKEWAGEYENLWELAINLNFWMKVTKTNKEALGAFLAGFPVYRIYPEEYSLRKTAEKDH